MKNDHFRRFFSPQTAAVLTAVVCFLAAAAGLRAAPANDNFASAVTLSGVSGTVNATNVAGTKEAGEQAHAFNRGGASVWYKFVAPGSGVLKVSASGIDALLAAYAGTTLANLKMMTASDDDDTNTGAATVNFGTVSGTTYYIAVDGKYFESTGVTTGSFTLTYSFLNTMPNDNFANAVTIAMQPADALRSESLTNVGATKETGEPNHSGNIGGNSVWYKWTSPAAAVKSYTFTLEQTSVANPNSQMIPLFAIYTGSSVDTLTHVAHYGSDRFGKLTLVVQPGATFYIAVDGYNFGGGNGAQLGNFILSVGITKSVKNPDLDRDGRADVAVYRSSTGVFYTLDSATDALRAVQWGLNGDKPLFGEIDGDGRQDYFVFRPGTGTWYETRSFSAGAFFAFNWGVSTDVPLNFTIYNQASGGDFSYAAVFRPTTGTWWIYQGGLAPITFQFGLNGDIPMTFDYDGDGTDEIAVFRPSNGTWYLAKPLTGQFVGAFLFGQAGDVPVPADYDGDGMSDIAVYRPTTGTWWFRNTQTGAQTAVQFGINTDKPQPADYDGDGKADPAVFRSGIWWILRSSNGAPKTVQFGLATDTPAAAPVN